MMSTLFAQAIPQQSTGQAFLRFILYNKLNKRLLLIAVIGGLVQFTVFKFFYPYPDFISDSYSYIDTNLYHMKVNLWPIGYSKFILFIHSISSSHQFLVFIQYIIQLLSLLYFFYSVLYLFGLSRSHTVLLFIFLFFNPMFLFLANCVLSDALFCAITITILSLYFWMFRQPKLSHLFLQAILIGTAFSLRYTAIYYPFVGAAAILLAAYKLPMKVAGIIGPWIFIIPFIIYTQQKTKEATGTAEFSVFGGWQLANNALYMYDHISVDSTRLPKGTLEIDRLARNYFKNVPPEYRDLRSVEGTFFMKVPNAILKPYMFSVKQQLKYTDDAPGQFLAWGKVSPLYQKYGAHLIKTHPFAFAKYYLWLNTKNYFIPYPEKFGFYNVGALYVEDAAATWFDLKTNVIRIVPSIEFQGKLFFLFPFLFTGLNWYYIILFGYLLVATRFKERTRLVRNAILLSAIYLAFNFGFSVFATPVVLRYQVVPMIILLTLSLILTESLDRIPKSPKKEPGA